jgi:hypothetical protein
MPQFNTPIQNSQFDPYSYEKQIEKLSGNSQGLQDTPIGNADSTINPISSVKAEEGFSLLSSDEEARSTILESKAADQSALELTGKMLYNIVDTALFELAKTPGYIIGGLGAAGKEIATGGKADTMGMIVDNFWVNAFEKLQQDSKDVLPVYISKDVQEGNLITKATSGEWWASTGADGIGFLLSMMIPGQASKLLGLGAKLGTSLETIGNSSKWVGKVLSKTGVVEDIANSGQVALKNSFGTSANSVISASLNTFTEAAAEGANTFDNVKKSLIGKGISEEEANKEAGNAAAGVFKSNMALLMVSNLLDEAWLWKGFSNPQTKGSNKILDKIFTKTQDGNRKLDFAELEKLSAKGWKDALIEGSANFGKQFAKEGFFEEGSQTTLQQNIEKKGEAGFTNNLYNIGAEYFTDFMDNKELHESIFLGGVLGGGMSVLETKNNIQSYNNQLFGSSAYSPSGFWAKFLGKKERKEQKGLVGLFKDNYVNNFNSILDVAQKDASGKPIFKDGKVIVDEEKYAALAEEKANLIDAHIKYDIAVATNNKMEQDTIGDILTYNYLQPFLNQEGGYQTFKEHVPQVVDSWAKQYEQTTGVEATTEQKNQFKEQLETKAEEFNNLYQEVEQTHSPERFVNNNNSPEYKEWKNKLFNDKINLAIQNRTIQRTEKELRDLQQKLQDKLFLNAVDELNKRNSVKTEWEKTIDRIKDLEGQSNDVSKQEREIKGEREGLIIQMVQKLNMSVKEAEEKVGTLEQYAQEQNKDYETNNSESLVDLRNRVAQKYKRNKEYLDSVNNKKELKDLKEKEKTLPKNKSNLSDMAPDPVSQVIAKFYEENLKRIEKAKPELKSNYLKLFTKEGVKQHYDNFTKGKQAFQEAAAETIQDEAVHAQTEQSARDAYNNLRSEAVALGYDESEPIIVKDKSGKRFSINVDNNGTPTITGVTGEKPLTPKMLEKLSIVTKEELNKDNNVPDSDVEHGQVDYTNEPNENPESISDVFAEKQLGLNRFVVAGLNILYELGGKQAGQDLLLPDGLPKMNESVSQQNWYNKMDEIARDPKDDISNYSLGLYKPKYDNISDFEKQIGQNNPPRSRSSSDLVAVLIDSSGNLVESNGQYVFTSLWRPEVLYAEKPRLAPDAILQPLLKKIGVPYTPYKSLSTNSFNKIQSNKINTYLKVPAGKSFTPEQLYNQAVTEAREEYTQWYDNVVNLNNSPNTFRIIVKPTVITQGKPLTKRDQNRNIIWQPIVGNIKNIKLDNKKMGPEQLVGGKLLVVPKSGNLVVEKGLVVSGKPGDVLLTLNADNNVVPTKARLITDAEAELVMYLMSLGTNSQVSIPLPKDMFYKVGNIEIKDKVNLFFYRTGDKKLNAQLKNFSLLHTIINYGQKAKNPNETDEQFAERSKGTIYVATKTQRIVYTDWDGKQKSVSLNDVRNAVNNGDRSNPEVNELYTFLKQKRFNVSETMLQQNVKFPYPSLLRDTTGKPSITFNNSKTYYEHLLTGNDPVLTTSLVTANGYPQFVQRNLAFDPTLTVEENPVTEKTQRKPRSKKAKEPKQDTSIAVEENDESIFIFDDSQEQTAFFNSIREGEVKPDISTIGGLEPIQDGNELLKSLENYEKQATAQRSILEDIPDMDTGLDMDKIYSPNELLTIKLKNGEIKQSCK